MEPSLTEDTKKLLMEHQNFLAKELKESLDKHTAAGMWISWMFGGLVGDRCPHHFPRKQIPGKDAASSVLAREAHRAGRQDTNGMLLVDFFFFSPTS